MFKKCPFRQFGHVQPAQKAETPEISLKAKFQAFQFVNRYRDYIHCRNNHQQQT